jgi:hypothetical protein
VIVAGTERIGRPPVQAGIQSTGRRIMRLGISLGGLILLIIILWLLFGR